MDTVDFYPNNIPHFLAHAPPHHPSVVLLLTKDTLKSYVIIFAKIGNERLAVHGCFLVLFLRVSTPKIPLRQPPLFCLN